MQVRSYLECGRLSKNVGGCGPVRIRIDRRDCIPLRFFTKNICVRLKMDDREENEHIYRTVVRKASKTNVEDGSVGVQGAKCIKKPE